MKEEIAITNKGIYQLYNHASVNNQSELLEHLNLKQNVVYVAYLTDENKNKMKKLNTGANLTVTPLPNSQLADFQFTFYTFPDNTLNKMFHAVINHCETSGKLPKINNAKATIKAVINATPFYANIWKTDSSLFNLFSFNLPIFAVEIYK